MTQWHAATASARGRHHEASDQPNQDHALAEVRDGLAIACVADGHGAPRYTRADRGSRLATVAMDACLDGPAVPTDQLPVALVRRWRDLVEADLDRDPPGGDQPLERYGTTALGARLDDDGLLLVQLGDGDIVVVDREGTPRLPVPRVAYPFPNATDSMVQHDAALHVRVVQVTDLEPRAVLLATDGLEANHSRAEGWQEAFAERLLEELAGTPPAKLTSLLERHCLAAAEHGGDDATMALLVHEDLLAAS